MAVIITDETLVTHCRAKGLSGPISKGFLDDYRMSLAKQALCGALLDRGVKPGDDLSDHLDNIGPAAEAKLREMVDAL